MEFCSTNVNGVHGTIHSGVLDILTKSYGNLGSLFSGPEIKRTIEERYEEMKSDYDKDEVMLGKCYPIQPNTIQPNVDGAFFNLGHDLPIWFTPSDKDCSGAKCFFEDERLEGKRIMIIGLEPKRKDQESGYITFSTPWGLHHKKYRTGKTVVEKDDHLREECKSRGSQAKFMNDLICSLVENRASVYLTDAYKFYYTEKIDGELCPPSKELVSLFKEIINDEIALFAPDLIIALGKSNKKRLEDILPLHNVIVLNHINTQGWTKEKRQEYYTSEIQDALK